MDLEHQVEIERAGGRGGGDAEKVEIERIIPLKGGERWQVVRNRGAAVMLTSRSARATSTDGHRRVIPPLFC